MDRRAFLKAGSLLAAGLGSGSVFAQQEKPPKKVKSVIWLWLDGAPSQYDTWDPKPEHRYGGGVKSIETSAKDIRIAETLPKCARVMDRMSLVRSVTHWGRDSADSVYLMHAGLYPSCWDCDVSIGSILAYELWDRASGAPPFIAIDAPPIPESWTLGDLFLPMRLPGGRLEGGRGLSPAAAKLLQAQDQGWGADRKQKPLAEFAEMRKVADAWMKWPGAEALDLSKEPKELRDAYGPGFGQRCLQARRLIESGVAVVEVGLSGGDADWRAYYGQMDAGIAALIGDLSAKDLLKDTVVFVGSEGGRYPWVMEERSAERWTKGFPVLLAGGHLVGGRASGDTGEGGLEAKPPVPLWNLFATLFRACAIDYNKKYETNGRKAKYVSQNGSVSTQGTPIKEFF
jgi:hypothetical protein